MIVGPYNFRIRAPEDAVRAMRFAHAYARSLGEIGFDPEAAGVRYRRDPDGYDRLELPSEIAKTGAADCEGLTLCLGLTYDAPLYVAEYAPGYGIHVRLLNRDPALECLITNGKP